MDQGTRFPKVILKPTRTDANTIADTPLSIEAVPGQTGPLMQFVNAAGVVTRAFGPDGLDLDSDAAGKGLLRTARAKYVFATDGGAVGAITPAANCTIPDNAVILGGIINAIVAPTSGGAATIAIGTTAGSSATSLKAATAIATFSIDSLVATVPVFTAASAVKMTAAGQIKLTVAVDALTAGTIEITLVYFLASA